MTQTGSSDSSMRPDQSSESAPECPYCGCRYTAEGPAWDGADCLACGSHKTSAAERFLIDTSSELARAMEKWPAQNSAHESYAVILEEVEEFWAEVRKKQTEYDPEAMYAELLQIAAMAARAAVDVVMPMIAGAR